MKIFFSKTADVRTQEVNLQQRSEFFITSSICERERERERERKGEGDFDPSLLKIKVVQE